ncbi:MAG: hypothetical protein L6Q76_06190, partial [Polyangiaceae bacterium]|nr:hypothetical protein [Polyangiaceae bacterium]
TPLPPKPGAGSSDRAGERRMPTPPPFAPPMRRPTPAPMSAIPGSIPGERPDASGSDTGPPSSPPSERFGPMSSPLSRRRPHGCLWRVTKWIEERHGAFLVSRLIIATGIKLRSFEATTPDNPDEVRAIERALRTLLSPDELNEVSKLLWERT